MEEPKTIRRYGTTALKTLARHCPRALDHYEERAPRDRRIFATGIAAHHVLHACGEETNRLGRFLDADELEAVALASCERLIEEGRDYAGEPEGPLPPVEVFAGRDLALDWLANREQLPVGALYEVGAGLDPKWRAVSFDDDRARLRTVLDRVDPVDLDGEGEEPGPLVVTVHNYKTAWPTSSDELSTPQLKAEGLMVAAHFPEAEIIRRRVSNLRTGRVYEHELWRSQDGPTLREWKEELAAIMRAADAQASSGKARPAVPGGGCFGCPYLQRCEEGQAFVGDVGSYTTKEDRARAYIIANGTASVLKGQLVADVAEGPIDVGDALLGNLPRNVRAVNPGAHHLLLEEWEARGGDVGGLLFSLDLGVGQFEKACKAMGMSGRGGKEDRDAFMEQVVTVYTEPRFGWKHKAEDEEEGA